MVFKEITQTGTDVTILTVPNNKILKITGLIIHNASANSATITLKDTYTYPDGTQASRTILKIGIATEAIQSYDEIKGEEIFGTLTINTDQQPIRIYVGVEEK